jgi:murein DD-endopeptidase MepM/ murein hydrolase activator NlpD
VLLEITSPRPLEILRATGFGRGFPLSPEGDGSHWRGLVGIDLDTKPGTYTIRLSGAEKGGKPVSGEHVLAVRAKKFPTRELTVDPKYVTPPSAALARIREESERVQAVFAAVTPERYWRGAFLLPVPGEVISDFGKRSVYNGQPRSPHTGTDFRAAEGTPVRAPNAGRIVLAANLYYSGNTVILDHGLGLYSYFGHLSSFSVRPGDRVKTGDTVGRAGATGLVTGPHLHWTVRLANTRVDPLSVVSALAQAGANPRRVTGRTGGLR